METPNLGQRIQQRRTELGLSQTTLSDMAGCSRSHLSHIERGQDRPSEELLERLSTSLGISLSAPPTRTRDRRRLRDLVRVLRRQFPARYRPGPGEPVATAYRLACGFRLGRVLLDCLMARAHRGAEWRALRHLARGLNGPEQLALLHMLNRSGWVQELHPHELGFPLPVLQTPDRWWLGVVVSGLVIFPQVEVGVGRGRTRRLDFLCLRPGSPAVALELDGPTHNREADRRRDHELGELGLQTIRTRVWDLDRNDWWERLAERLAAA